MEGKHWGGFLDNTSNFTSPYLLSFDEIEKLSKEFVSCSPGKNVKSENVMTTQMMPISYFEMDPITQHNIQLVQYTKQMQELLQKLQQSYKVFCSHELTDMDYNVLWLIKKCHLERIPPVPTRAAKQHIQEHHSIKLTRRGVQQVLHRSIYQMCAHEGFDSTTESVISVLVGVAEEMLVKFCNLLKVNTEREMLGLSTGYVDAMERTLYDMGVNGVRDLHNFHINRVLRYNERLQMQSHSLRRACVKAAAQWENSKPADSATPWEDPEWVEWTEWSGNETADVDSSFNRDSSVKPLSESTVNSEAVNQLHLEDNTVISAPGLESGLRMLYTLEQQEAVAASGSGSMPHLIKEEEEDSQSPCTNAIDSTSPATSNIKRNGGKKPRKL